MILAIILGIVIICLLGKVFDFIWDGIGCMFIVGVAMAILAIIAYAVFSLVGLV